MPAIFGSALSVFDTKREIPNKIYDLIEFFFGISIAIYFSPSTIKFLSIEVGTGESWGISFALGYIGLTILRNLKTKIAEVVNLLIEKYFGK